MNDYWFRRRFVDVRLGHSIYLLFPLTIGNFILITYRFFIEEESIFLENISNLWFFGIIFLISYVPISIIIGYGHRKTQLKVDRLIKLIENPYYAKMFKVLLDAKTGKLSDEEIKKFRKSLLDIEKKGTV